MSLDRESNLERIQANIERFGQHVYSIKGGESPRYLYTIGLKDVIGGELVLAGLAHVSTQEAVRVLNRLGELLRGGISTESAKLESETVGMWSLRESVDSWNERLLLGVFDYYGCEKTRAWQVFPTDPSQHTIDLPDMTQVFRPKEHPVWKWLEGGWAYPVPADTMIVTNLDALLGYAVSELTRWEDTEWEMFSGAGPDVPKEEMLLVPLATLLAFDSSLEEALTIESGQGLYREFDEKGQAGPWQPWRSKQSG